MNLIRDQVERAMRDAEARIELYRYVVELYAQRVEVAVESLRLHARALQILEQV